MAVPWRRWRWNQDSNRSLKHAPLHSTWSSPLGTGVANDDRQWRMGPESTHPQRHRSGSGFGGPLPPMELRDVILQDTTFFRLVYKYFQLFFRNIDSNPHLLLSTHDFPPCWSGLVKIRTLFRGSGTGPGSTILTQNPEPPFMSVRAAGLRMISGVHELLVRRMEGEVL